LRKSLEQPLITKTPQWNIKNKGISRGRRNLESAKKEKVSHTDKHPPEADKNRLVRGTVVQAFA